MSADERQKPSFVAALDARQRAMLAEMGVRVWAPRAPVSPPQAPVEPPVAKAAETAEAATAAPATGRPPVPLQPAAPSREPARAPARPPGAVAADTSGRPGGVGQMDWAQLREAVSNCQACGLCRSRTRTVFGAGDLAADWMIVGEAPGENEDRQGEPFVGAAGQLLDRMLQAAGRSRQGQGAEGVYIANVLKCRPPANRNPQPEEMAQCEPYLVRQVELLRPRLILAMGRFAVQSLLGSTEPIGRLRGRVHRYHDVPVIVTYHPAYLLRNPIDKRKAWADLCLAMETTGQ
ncbi:MAG: uracil-DNA glycosylase [Burkholderiales bacterium]|nr:MAG: uracil-DNA glycosylase [Burkholderiales bacterium]